MRNSATEPELLFFLALLLNLSDRASVFDLLKVRCPGCDPTETALGWLKDLSHLGLLGEIRLDGSVVGRVLEQELYAPTGGESPLSKSVHSDAAAQAISVMRRHPAFQALLGE